MFAALLAAAPLGAGQPAGPPGGGAPGNRSFSQKVVRVATNARCGGQAADTLQQSNSCLQKQILKLLFNFNINYRKKMKAINKLCSIDNK